ncbi:MAG: hydrogenase expression/formation protein HypE [candidate division KSB1 bacterium]|nr:hydrogenase expression/formation protein HypE [candidate division KSB1 bacterium]
MSESDLSFSCPLPLQRYEHILTAHGGGGSLSRQLIEELFLPAFDNPLLRSLHDGAVFSACGRLAFTTDSYVVSPIFFPGGDIGELAVNGTVNDLAMCGAQPLYLSVGMILEEGLLMEELIRVVQSMQRAAKAAGVTIVTGDTKVVERGKGDKMFINTSGIGVVPAGREVAATNCRPGDRIIISADIGRHGAAIMAAREGLEFESAIQSDTAPLNGLVEAMFQASAEIRMLRDPTRGGLSSALNEIAQSAGLGIVIEEERIPVQESVRSTCEILGLDPLYMANEGVLVAVVSPQATDAVLEAMRKHPQGVGAAVIGTLTEKHSGRVLLQTSFGKRILDMISGEQLPRIC